MAFPHPEYIGPTLVALVLAIYPLPWHFRTRNIATLSMIFWMTALNLVHTVNCVVWSDNTKVVAKPWGDFTAVVVVGYNYGLPLAHLLLAKQLESYTTLRHNSPLYDHESRRRHRRFDLIVTFAGPLVGVLLHLSMMDRRFYVVEAFGPLPSTYWDTWGVIGMAIVPILIAGACAVYTVMAMVNVYLRRQQMLSLIASNASVNREQFYRLMFLTVAELGTCGLRAIFNLMSFQNGPQPLGHRGPPRHNFTIVEQVTLSQVSKTGRKVLNLQYFTVVACSTVFFLCFATSTETKKFYWGVVRRVFPCVPEKDDARQIKLGSVDSSGSRSYGSRGGVSTSTFSHGTDLRSPTSPVTPQKDISLEEMLGSSTIPKLDKTARWPGGTAVVGVGGSMAYPEEEEADEVYLASYDDAKEKEQKKETV